MNWKILRSIPFADTRALFVSQTARAGSLLDIGSSDGQTLGHFHELRPDLTFYATDQEGEPQTYPAGCHFFRGDIQKDDLPWPDETIDAITCMHLVEHLTSLDHLLSESARLLRRGSCLYIETPHPKTAEMPSIKNDLAGTFTLNFYDDPTHTEPVAVGRLAEMGRSYGLEPVRSGISRNWLFASLYLLFFFLPASRKKYICYAHFCGWSAYLVCKKS